MTKGPLELVGQVAAILDELEISYALGGSMASSLIGEPRSTFDADIAMAWFESLVRSVSTPVEN